MKLFILKWLHLNLQNCSTTFSVFFHEHLSHVNMAPLYSQVDISESLISSSFPIHISYSSRWYSDDVDTVFDFTIDSTDSTDSGKCTMSRYSIWWRTGMSVKAMCLGISVGGMSTLWSPLSTSISNTWRAMACGRCKKGKMAISAITRRCRAKRWNRNAKDAIRWWLAPGKWSRAYCKDEKWLTVRWDVSVFGYIEWWTLNGLWTDLLYILCVAIYGVCVDGNGPYPYMAMDYFPTALAAVSRSAAHWFLCRAQYDAQRLKLYTEYLQWSWLWMLCQINPI